MKVGIIGGGAFGTALASVFALGGNDVQLWMRDPENAKKINEVHENHARLPGIKLPTNCIACHALDALADCEAILLVLPAQQTREWLASNAAALPQVPLICCAKGIDRDTGKFQTELVEMHRSGDHIAVLSGPGFATEIAAGRPTAMAIGSKNIALAQSLQGELSTPTMRLYHNDDTLGTQLGGALKNIIAIGCGISIGAGLGQSARAALLTRGFAEMIKLGMAYGARAETLGGLAGLGDLTLTATSKTSRNYALGLAMGSDAHIPENTTTEGAYTASVALNMARQKNLELPVIETIARVVDGEFTTQDAVENLFSRPLTKEF